MENWRVIKMSDWLTSQRMVLREVAQEFVVRQTLAMRLKSEPEQKHLISIVGERAKFSDFVKAAAVSYIYHYRGIHTLDTNLTLGEGVASNEEVAFVKKQLNQLYSEVDILLADSFQKEREILGRQIEIQSEAAKVRLKGESKNKIQKLIQDQLIEIYAKYPKTHFIDFLGNITYFTPPIRIEKIKLLPRL